MCLNPYPPALAEEREGEIESCALWLDGGGRGDPKVYMRKDVPIVSRRGLQKRFLSRSVQFSTASLS
jgi:hypothetical protein